MPHNAAIFKGTVESNLRMAKPDATETELWNALEQVNLADFCRSQNGLQTALHEGGSNLSGGQRQRLAMARALLHDTPIYLFDEATSNVDAESENDIMRAIHSLAGKKTIILISHRLANVVHSDCIYAMSNGRVIEQGTHAELLAKQGAYSRLYLHNTASEKWQFLNSYKDGTITADTAGSYLLTNQNLRFTNINWTFFIAAGALTVVCLIVYIAVKKRYWFW